METQIGSIPETNDSFARKIGRFSGLVLGVLAGSEIGFIEAAVGAAVGAVVGDFGGKKVAHGF